MIKKNNTQHINADVLNKILTRIKSRTKILAYIYRVHQTKKIILLYNFGIPVFSFVYI